ncbi:MAG: Enoyl-CoA hydratase [Hydrocarboniphaga sp.]|uniref:enoyl-CoA hydratase n=1 Tax=Hydrocarboniphaga sp. TaxID=2033016 RepID=UPI0026287EE4|nr:enoyl-CoA hydratase [Hydrocarboniphaga sp.]MDB5970236.1 Enoyl-CoA hydratase [Hydrocarboniphaga sp.]
MTYSEITYEQLGAVVRVCHDRPFKANAESEQLLAELDHALECAKNDDSVRVLILGGKGAHFSAGHDLAEGAEKRGHHTPEQHWLWEQEHYYGNAMRIRDFPKPTIAQVQGACIAAGFMVANSCDLMVASEDAFFSDPVVHSLGAAGVEALVHPWVLGLRKAKEFLFTGQRLSAAEGKEWGMINHVVPRVQLEAFTLKLAQQIALAPPIAMRMIKRSLNRTADIQGYRNALDAHFDTHLLSSSTQEFKEMVARGMEVSMAVAKKAGIGP